MNRAQLNSRLHHHPSPSDSQNAGSLQSLSCACRKPALREAGVAPDAETWEGAQPCLYSIILKFPLQCIMLIK